MRPATESIDRPRRSALQSWDGDQWVFHETQVSPLIPAPLRSVFSVLLSKHGCLSEAQAAQLLKRSASRFRHLFKELTGETYQVVRLKLKLESGARLLLSTNWTIPRISLRLGYTERGTFEKAFKRYYRLTPTQYRQQFKPSAIHRKTNSHLAHKQPLNS